MSTFYCVPKDSDLMHYGIKGMRWGVRKQRSFSGNAHRALAGVYGLNERTYRRLGNNTLASMNASERKNQLKKAAQADNKKRMARMARNKAAYGRKAAKRSLSGRAHVALSKVYSLNEKTYRKIGNKTLASMNASAKNDELIRANAADERRRQRLRDRYGI